MNPLGVLAKCAFGIADGVGGVGGGVHGPRCHISPTSQVMPVPLVPGPRFEAVMLCGSH